MTDQDRIIVGDPKRSTAPRGGETPWWIAGLVGVLLLVVGGVDLGLLFYPLRVGTAEWEFGTFSRFFDGLPAITVGLAGLSAWAIATGSKAGRLVAGLVTSLLLAICLVGILLYTLTVPLALRSVEAELRVGIFKGVAKAAIASVSYILVYAVLAWKILRTGR